MTEWPTYVSGPYFALGIAMACGLILYGIRTMLRSIENEAVYWHRVNMCSILVESTVRLTLKRYAMTDTTALLGPVIRRSIAEHLEARGINAKQ